jgi:hypothetical protein
MVPQLLATYLLFIYHVLSSTKCSNVEGILARAPNGTPRMGILSGHLLLPATGHHITRNVLFTSGKKKNNNNGQLTHH